MSKTELKKIIKKQQLLSSAYELFTTEGFEDTSIMTIARNAGVGKGTFYLYFKSKDDIRDTLISSKSAQLLSDAARDLDLRKRHSDNPLPVTDCLLYLVEHILDQMLEDFSLLTFFNDSLSRGLFESSIGFPYSGELDGGTEFTNYVNSMLAEQGFTLRDPRMLCYTIAELMDSALCTALQNDRPIPFAAYKAYLFGVMRLIIEDSLVLNENN